MHYTIELIVKGDADVVGNYQRAIEHWDDILADHTPLDEDVLSASLQKEQFWFEKNCGGRWVGQEIMVVAGIARYYSTMLGFEENDNLETARKIYRAIQKSYCSMEVKACADTVAQSYGLLED